MSLDDVATRSQNLGESRGPESRSRVRIYLSNFFFPVGFISSEIP